MARVSLDPFRDQKQAVRTWLDGGMAMRGMTSRELSRKTGIPESTLSYRKRHPGTMRNDERWLIERAIGTPQDVARVML